MHKNKSKAKIVFFVSNNTILFMYNIKIITLG